MCRPSISGSNVALSWYLRGWLVLGKVYLPITQKKIQKWGYALQCLPFNLTPHFSLSPHSWFSTCFAYLVKLLQWVMIDVAERVSEMERKEQKIENKKEKNRKCTHHSGKHSFLKQLFWPGVCICMWNTYICVTYIKHMIQNKILLVS